MKKQNLYFNNQELENYGTFAEYKITNESIIDLIRSSKKRIYIQIERSSSVYATKIIDSTTVDDLKKKRLKFHVLIKNYLSKEELFSRTEIYFHYKLEKMYLYSWII